MKQLSVTVQINHDIVFRVRAEVVEIDINDGEHHLHLAGEGWGG